ncbi:Rz1-like lysis system protein LysC [Cochlodiniinecator piscidefendens]
MRIYLIGSLIILTACSAPRTETRFVAPEIPAALLAPCEVRERPRQTLRDVALILTDHVEALDACNGQIEGIAKIVGVKGEK